MHFHLASNISEASSVHLSQIELTLIDAKLRIVYCPGLENLTSFRYKQTEVNQKATCAAGLCLSTSYLFCVATLASTAQPTRASGWLASTFLPFCIALKVD